MKKMIFYIYISVGLIPIATAQNNDLFQDAFSGALIDLIVLTVLAFIIFKLLRSKKHPKSSIKDIANFWAACGGCLGTFSAGATWYQNNGVDFGEFMFYLFINMMIFPTTAYLLGLSAGFVSNNGKTNLTSNAGSEKSTENSNSKSREIKIMKFSESISVCLFKYATFSGRATRSEYWWFFLFYTLMHWATLIVDQVLIANGADYGFTNLMLGLGLFLPSIAVTVRRLHDTGRSGWWYFIVFTIIGIPFFIYWLAKKGDLGKNRYDTDYNTDNYSEDSKSADTAKNSISSEQLGLIEKLHDMKEKGIISEEEFQQKKSSLLNA